jgi:hypothetical protein
MGTATELIHKIQMGDIHGATGYLHQLYDENPHGGVEFEYTAEFVYAVRLAVSRDDVDMCELLTSMIEDRNKHVFDVETIAAAAIKSLPVFKLIVGGDGHGLTNPALRGNHPLVMASYVGNVGVAKYIVEWLRVGGGVYHTRDPNGLKTEALNAAVLANSIVVISMLITEKTHAVDAFTGLLKRGRVESAIRLSKNKFLDFCVDNFALLKLCAPYPSLLKHVMRHKSLVKFHKSMPTPYSQLAMDNAFNAHYETMDRQALSFRQAVVTCAASNVLRTGCSTHDAVTSAHTDMAQLYTAPMCNEM